MYCMYCTHLQLWEGVKDDTAILVACVVGLVDPQASVSSSSAGIRRASHAHMVGEDLATHHQQQRTKVRFVTSRVEKGSNTYIPSRDTVHDDAH